MKEIAPSDDADLEDTLTEIALQNMASKGHKNIIGINKSYECNDKKDNMDKFYLIMEWMDAGDLSTMLKTIPGEFSEEVIVYILKEILTALNHMHQNNQIHRDLKPLNVMLTTDGKIKLGDFGLAAQLVQDEYHQKEIKGTPKWMAPEILVTKPYNELVDIWSLGIIAYELATGKNPYQGRNLNMIMKAAKREHAPAIEDVGRWSPEFLDFVNNKCLVKNPAKRADSFELLNIHPLMTKVYPDNDELFDAYLIHLTNYMNTPKFKSKFQQQ